MDEPIIPPSDKPILERLGTWIDLGKCEWRPIWNYTLSRDVKDAMAEIRSLRSELKRREETD